MENEKIIKMANGNPGAVITLINLAETSFFKEIYSKLEKMNLNGQYVYVLFNDRSGGDINKFIENVRKLNHSKFETEFIKEKLSQRNQPIGIEYFYE